MSDDAAALILALAVENAELRTQLAEAQDLLVETAVDAGDLHARMEELQAELVQSRVERDVWRAEAEQARRTGEILAKLHNYRTAPIGPVGETNHVDIT